MSLNQRRNTGDHRRQPRPQGLAKRQARKIPIDGSATAGRTARGVGLGSGHWLHQMVISDQVRIERWPRDRAARHR